MIAPTPRASTEGAGALRPEKYLPGVVRAPRRIRKRYVRRTTVHVYPRSTSNLKLGR